MSNHIVNQLHSHLGTPYVWGGETPRGFDCSGLVQYVYDNIGIELPRTARTQVKCGEYVPKSELQKGDLVFFGNPKSPRHVGVYIGDGMMIHSPRTGDVVRIADLSKRKDYATARRVIA